MQHGSPVQNNTMTKIAIFGLGEAGSLIAADILQTAGSDKLDIEIAAYDPADVKTPAGVSRHANAQQAVSGADYVLSFTASVDATTALEQAIDEIPQTAVYADFASASAALKRQLAVTADRAGFRFCDVALMAMVPGNGVRTPSMFAGDGALHLKELMTGFGMPAEVVSDHAGDAAQRKLLRSVVVKGLAALLIESLEGAENAGCEQWLWKNLVDEFTAMDEKMLQRLVRGTGIHAQRRFHEMQASVEQLAELGLESLMTRSTVESLANVIRNGVPTVPDIDTVT